MVLGGLVVVCSFASMSVLGLVAMSEPLNPTVVNPSWWADAFVGSVAGLVAGVPLLAVGIVMLATRKS